MAFQKALNTTPLNAALLTDTAYGDSVHMPQEVSGEALTVSIGYVDVAHFLQDIDGEASTASTGFVDCVHEILENTGNAWINQDAIVEAWHELLENTGIAWPVYGCEVEAIHCAFESTGNGWIAVSGYGSSVHALFVSSGLLELSNYCIASHPVMQCEAAGTSITVVVGNTRHTMICSGGTDLFRFALGDVTHSLLVSAGVGYVTPPGISSSIHEQEESVGSASTCNWGLINAEHPVCACSGVAVQNPVAQGETTHSILMCYGTAGQEFAQVNLAYSRCKTTSPADTPSSSFPVLHYERCS